MRDAAAGEIITEAEMLRYMENSSSWNVGNYIDYRMHHAWDKDEQTAIVSPFLTPKFWDAMVKKDADEAYRILSNLIRFEIKGVMWTLAKRFGDDISMSIATMPSGDIYFTGASYMPGKVMLTPAEFNERTQGCRTPYTAGLIRTIKKMIPELGTSKAFNDQAALTQNLNDALTMLQRTRTVKGPKSEHYTLGS